MRLVVVALSTVLLSGCSWLGMGGSSASQYGYGGGAYSGGSFGAGCAPVGSFGAGSYGATSYSAGYGAAGCGPAGGYGVGGFGTGVAGAGGFGPGGFGTGVAGAGGFGAGGFGTGVAGAGGFGPGGFGTGVAGAGGFGAGTVTTLGANAPFGAAVNTVQGGIAGTQFAGGQFAGGNVTTVQGAPIYVGQPYAAYYGVPQLRGAAAALPFALTAGIGTNFDIGGDFFTEKPAGPATTGTGGLSAGRTVSALDSISYNQAFDSGIRYDLGAEFDVNQDTTLLSRIGYSQADGKRNNIGTVTEGGTTADLFAEFSDLEQYSIEGGVRKYVGGPNVGLRPYVGALGGFVYTDDVDVTQSSTAFAGGDETQQYLDGGWSPTATGVIGAEWQVGPRSAIGIESGIRWQDNGDTNFESKDRWSIPLSLRGRVAF